MTTLDLDALHTEAVRNADAAQRYADQALDDMRAAAQRYANASRSAIDARRLADGIKDRMNAEVHRAALDHTPPDPRHVRADPHAHVTEGDPDPHPENQDIDAEICWAQIDAGGLGIPDEYTCTRPENHPGQHIAGDGHEVVKVWNRG